MRLITIPFSHYCEKARWGLEHARLGFDEEGHAPLVHWQAVWRAGGRRTVPVLVTDDAVLVDSTDILRFADRRASADRRLYPTEIEPEVAALAARYDRELGPHARRIAYYHALPHRERVLQLAARGIPRWELAMLRATYPLVRALITRGLRISDDGVKRSLERVERVFADVGARLSDGRRYLAGDRFTAADLTFAALAAPLLFPVEHPRAIGDGAPPALLALRDRLRATRAGAHGLRMYRDHRR
jgi:glutathione S-transferase